jgi:hypothetical protein
MNNQEKYNLNWQSVESALEEGSSSGYKIAVLETAKLLSQALEEQNFSGKNFEERLNSAGKIFANKENVNQALEIRQKIIEQPYFDVSAKETKETIANFYQAIIDVTENQSGVLSKLNIFKNFSSKFKENDTSSCRFFSVSKIFKKGFIKKFIIGLFLFFLIVLILADTGPGQSLTNFIVDIAHFIFYKLLVVAAIAAAIIIAIIGTLSYLEGRQDSNRGRMKIE